MAGKISTFTISFLIFFFCCSRNFAQTAPATKPVKKDSTVSVVGKKWDVVISFISIGSGIDGVSYEKIEAFIKNHPKKLKHEIIQKGREGEKTIYVQLKKMKKEEKKIFIDEVNKLIVKPELVKVQQDVLIRKIRANF